MTEQKVISPSKLAHVVLRTPRFGPMVSFYKTILGAHATFENEFAAFLTYDAEHHRIAIVSVPGTGDKVPTSAGLEHIAFTYESLSQLALSYQQRKAHGTEPWWCVNHGTTTSMYYQDPDGNNIELQVDNFDTMDEANAFMAGPRFRENPFGVDFDPDELLKRVRSGEAESEIKKRPNTGPRAIESLPNPPVKMARTSY